MCCIDQGHCDLRVAFISRPHQRSAASIILQVQLGTHTDQRVHQLHVATSRRLDQRRAVLLTAAAVHRSPGNHHSDRLHCLLVFCQLQQQLTGPLATPTRLVMLAANLMLQRLATTVHGGAQL